MSIDKEWIEKNEQEMKEQYLKIKKRNDKKRENKEVVTWGEETAEIYYRGLTCDIEYKGELK